MRSDRSSRWTLLGVTLVVAVVGLFWWLSERQHDWQSLPVTEITAASGSEQVSIRVQHGVCPDDPSVEVVFEDREVIRLRPEMDYFGDCDLVEMSTTIDVQLEAELGERRIEVEQAVRRLRGECIVDEHPSNRCQTVPYDS